MAKTDATRRKKKQRKVLQEDTADTDPQTNTVIKVKGNAPTVTVSWKKKNEEGEDGDTQMTLDASDQMTAKKMTGFVNGKQKAVKNRPSKKTKANNDGFRICIGNLNRTKTYQEVNESLEKYFMSQSLLFQDIQLDQSRKHALVDLATEMDLTKVLALNGELLLNKPMKITKVKIKSEDKSKVKARSLDKKVNGKRKADPIIEDSPSKKAKLINEGFCLFVGNLNSSKKSEEVKESLENYLMSQSLLFQDIRLDRSRKHAFVDLLSEMDLNKALTLNGEVLLDKPMKIAKAKIKSEENVKVKSPELKKQARDARCLFVKNLPYNATKQDILKIFHKSVAIRFPGGTEGPTQGIAFLEFKNTAIARKVQKQKQGVKIQKRVLIVNRVGDKSVRRVTKADVENKRKKDKKALQSSQNIEAGKKEATEESCEKPEKAKVLTKTLIVMGLTEKTSPETLQSLFEGAVNARVTVNRKDVSKSFARFGFVSFGSEESCKAAKEAMEDCEIDGCKVTIAYAHPKRKNSLRAQGGLEGDLTGKSAGKGRRGGASQGAEGKQKN